jgi:hypothetical protein
MPAIGPDPGDGHSAPKENKIPQKYNKRADCIVSMVYAVIQLR